MNSLDEAIERGNIIEVIEYQKSLSEITEQFIKNEIPTQKIDVSIAIGASLNNVSLEFACGIPLVHKSKRRINMNFLLDIAKYGLTRGYGRD